MQEHPDEGAPSESAPAPVEPPRTEPAEGPPTPPAEEDWATRFKYLLADFENFRKRVDRETESARLRARNGVLKEILPIYESVERARDSLDALPKSDPVRHGVELIAREFRAFLDREGVKPVAHVGGPFDPSSHEAVGETAASEKAPDGSIGGIVQQGYRSSAGLVRPAKVLIAREPRLEPLAEVVPDKAELPSEDSPRSEG